MAIQRTFSIIKPDATKRNLTGKINALFEDAGLLAYRRSAPHSHERRASKSSTKFMLSVRSTVSWLSSATSEPVVVQVLEGEDAVAKHREVIGRDQPSRGC